MQEGANAIEDRLGSLPAQLTAILKVAPERSPALRCSQRRWSDTTAPDHLVGNFAHRFCRNWPGTSLPVVYYAPRSLELGGAKGVLHAKAIVTDDESVVITSANLTEVAHERNIEIGRLVRDPAPALCVTSHFRALIEQACCIRCRKPRPSLKTCAASGPRAYWIANL